MKYAIIILLIILLPCTVAAHGGATEASTDPVLTLPQIFGITVLAAVLLLVLLHIIGVTDRKFLLQMLVVAVILLSLDYLYVSTYT